MIAVRPLHPGGIGWLRRVRVPPCFWLTLAAAAPFGPGAWQFMHRGIADVLATGDGAALEMGTLHAVHGTQLLGPYSRFQWNHPGPAFFYLASPLYEAFHRRGPTLNLTCFLLNLGCAVALVSSARRVGGAAFALCAALLLAAYESIGGQFPLSSAWNPIVPILPLGLASLLCARIALGDSWAVPAFAFVASAIVETHVGFVPEVGVLVSLAVALPVLRRLLRWRPARPDTDAVAVGRAPIVGPASLTVAVLFLLWLPPVIECRKHPPGNIVVLYRFFTAPHAPEHPWAVVFDTVSRQLVQLPLALGQALGISTEPSTTAAEWMAGAWWAALLFGAVAGGMRGDPASAVLAAIALAEAIGALFAVRAIQGEIHFYLVTWVALVGLVGFIALARWGVVAVERLPRGRAARGGFVAVSIAALLYCVRAQASTVDVYDPPDPEVERFAREIYGYLTATRTPPPVFRIAVHDVWGKAVSVALYLFKKDFPFFVSRDWLFMMGRELAPPAEEGPVLLIGDRAFFDKVQSRPDLHLVSLTHDVCAFLSDPTYLTDHRIAGPGVLLAASGVRGEPARAVDAVVPPEGERWDSPLSVVLESTGSAIEVALPSANVSGVVLSVDSGDVYAVRCRRDDGAVVDIGSVTTVSRTGVGVATAAVYSEALGACHSVLVSPASGDGYYSVGEIGFVRP